MRFLSTLAASVLGSLIAVTLVIFLGMVFLVGLAATGDQVPSVRSGSVLVAELSGAWPEAVSGDPLAAAFGGEPRVDLHDVTGAFRKAAADDRIAAVWLKVGSPASGWASLEAVRRAIEEVRAAGKPVYATSADYLMNEAGYFLASAADSAFLEAEGLFEFNGFALDVLFYRRLLERAGVGVQAIRAGQYKGAVEPFTREGLSEPNQTQLRDIVVDTHRRFVGRVAESRRLDESRLSRLMQTGGTFTAREAVEAGLVDALAHADQVEGFIRRRLGLAEDARFPTVALPRYAMVPPAQAGLHSGGRDEIAVVIAEGQMVSGESRWNPILGSGGLGAETIMKALRDARESSAVKSVVLRINSPGGFAPAADAMLREVELLSREKPVVVSMGDLAASGGYWIAAAADTVVAEPLTLTGSIGVFSLLFDASELLSDRLGVTFDVVTTAPSSDMLSMLRPLRADEVARLEASVDRTYEAFLGKVAKARGMTVDEVDAVGQGRIWTGQAALGAGLVDVLGGLDTAVRLAAARAGLEEGAYRVREFPRQKTFLERLTESLESRAAALAARVGMVPSLADPLIRTASEWEGLLRSAGSVQARMPVSLTIR